MAQERSADAAAARLGKRAGPANSPANACADQASAKQRRCSAA
jgi:hypothetical protein